MSIPVSTHRIRVERGTDPATVDPWEKGSATEPEVIARGVRAVISVPGGRGAGGAAGAGDSESVEYVLVCDPVDLSYLDVVVDEGTDQRYAVRWAVASPGLGGLASVRAGLNTYRGFGQESETA